jgi:hypothetical protein
MRWTLNLSHCYRQLKVCAPWVVSLGQVSLCTASYNVPAQSRSELYLGRVTGDLEATG